MIKPYQYISYLYIGSCANVTWLSSQLYAFFWKKYVALKKNSVTTRSDIGHEKDRTMTFFFLCNTTLTPSTATTRLTFIFLMFFTLNSYWKKQKNKDKLITQILLSWRQQLLHLNEKYHGRKFFFFFFSWKSAWAHRLFISSSLHRVSSFSTRYSALNLGCLLPKKKKKKWRKIFTLRENWCNAAAINL